MAYGARSVKYDVHNNVMYIYVRYTNNNSNKKIIKYTRTSVAYRATAAATQKTGRRLGS